MSMRWLDIKLDAEAAQHRDAFWNSHRETIQDGSFWAEKIKELKDTPNERLQLALDNLPLPAAFREAAIAVRAMIRDARTRKQDWQAQLEALYGFAAYESFMVDYAPLLQQPGYNVMESIPGTVVTSLPFAYSQLGYRNLNLLNKTDVKWLVEAWGEPQGHTTLNLMHKCTWDQYEAILVQNKLADDQKLRDKISDLVKESPLKRPHPGLNQPTRKWWQLW